MERQDSSPTIRFKIDKVMTAVSSGSQLRPTRDKAIQGAPGALGGPIDSHVEVGLGIVDGDCGTSFEAYLDTAALVDAALRPIDIGEPDHDARNDIAAMVQGIPESPDDVVAQSIGQVEVVGMDLNLHVFPFGNGDEPIMGTAIVRRKQINL